MASTKAPVRRAKRACKACNARRVRCDVSQSMPCANCHKNNTQCELMTSRRGKYQRLPRQEADNQLPQDTAATHARQSPRRQSEDDNTCPQTQYNFASILGPDNFTASQPLQSDPLEQLTAGADLRQRDSIDAISWDITIQPHAGDDTPGHDSQTVLTEEDVGNAVYLGESTSVRYAYNDVTPSGQSQDSGSGSACSDSVRLLYPVSKEMKKKGIIAARQTRDKQARAAALQLEGRLTLPARDVLESLLRAYFTRFHPSFPIVDRLQFIRAFNSNAQSPFLTQAMCFIGAFFCSQQDLERAGLETRQDAKGHFYYNAKAIYDADLECNKIVVLQSLFLMSFWRAGPLLEKNTRHWLGAALSLAQSTGLHRSQPLHQSKVRKRIWWCLYLRERQCSAALGLPSRVHDDDCDIEPLDYADFDDGDWREYMHILGAQTNQHIYYVMELCKLAIILGRILSTQFKPRLGTAASTRSVLKDDLETWKRHLPNELKGDSVAGGSNCFFPDVLQLAYNNLLILLYRDDYVSACAGEASAEGEVAYQAACRTTRIIADMLAEETAHYAQVHVITNLFNALCIHTISIRRTSGAARKVAEHRAKMCLLGLAELQKTWESDNWVLGIFLEALDRSVAKKLISTLEDDTVDNEGGRGDGKHQGQTSMFAAPRLGAEIHSASLNQPTQHSINDGLSHPIGDGSWISDDISASLFGADGLSMHGTLGSSLLALDGMTQLDLESLAKCL